MLRNLGTATLVAFVALSLSGCIINTGGSYAAGSGGASTKDEDAPYPPEFGALAADKLPPNAPGLTVVYGESRVMDMTLPDFPDVVVRGHYSPEVLRNIRISTVTDAKDALIGQNRQIQIYNAGVDNLDITVRTLGFDSNGILRSRKEERQLLRARDIFIPESNTWSISPGFKIQYTIFVE